MRFVCISNIIREHVCLNAKRKEGGGGGTKCTDLNYKYIISLSPMAAREDDIVAGERCLRASQDMDEKQISYSDFVANSRCASFTSRLRMKISFETIQTRSSRLFVLLGKANKAIRYGGCYRSLSAAISTCVDHFLAVLLARSLHSNMP